MKLLIHSETSISSHILYWVFEISMLGLKLNHASKRGLWYYWPHIDVYWNCFLDQWHRFHINHLSSFRVGNIFFTHRWQRLVQTGNTATNIISSYVSLTQLGLVSRLCCLKTNLSPTVTYVYSKKCIWNTTKCITWGKVNCQSIIPDIN